MNVTNNNSVGPNSIGNRSHVRSVGQQYQKAEMAPRREDSDGVDLSEQARLLQKMGEDVGNVDETRRKKVADIKAAVESGNYPLSPVEIARALLASRRNGETV